MTERKDYYLIFGRKGAASLSLLDPIGWRCIHLWAPSLKEAVEKGLERASSMADGDRYELMIVERYNPRKEFCGPYRSVRITLGNNWERVTHGVESL